jgi:uncharacterized caspase-like protein
MYWFAWLSLQLLALWLSLTPADAKRVALVIGNSAYRVGPLTNPTSDAEAVAAALSEIGFDQVILKRDLGMEGMRAALKELGGAITGAEIGAVFFAGHGTEIGGRNYLIPVDASLPRAADIDLEAISLDTVLRQLDGVTKLKLVILDACRNNIFPLAGASRSQSRGLARIEPEDNTLIAYAAKEGTIADDGEGRHSPFTAALLKHIGTPGLEIRFLFAEVRDDVLAATGHQQQPHLYGTLGREHIVLKPSVPGDPCAVAADHWKIAESIGTLAALEDHVAGFSGCPFAALARARIEKLRATPAAVTPRAVAPPRPRAAREVCGSFDGSAGVDHYCASSVLPPQFGNAYGVENLFNDDTTKAWVEGTQGREIGEWIVVEFDHLRLVKTITIRNGYQKNADIFYKNSRVRRIRLVFSQGERVIFSLEDRQGAQTLRLDHPIKAYWVQFVIEEIFAGQKYTDTAISKLLIGSERAP